MTRVRLLFSHATIWLIACAVVAGVVTVASSGQPWLFALALLGVPLQMLNEYSVHRFLLHWPPPRSQWGFDLLYRAHYGHHDFPTNTELFFAPMIVVLPVLLVSFCVTWAVLAILGLSWALPGAAAVVGIGGGLTFLSYEWFHATAHLPVSKTAIERHVTRLHGQHHFRDFNAWFHVTAGGEVIDRVMGTALDEARLKAQGRHEFIRTLGMRPDDERLIAARRKFADRYGLSDDEIARAARA